MTAPAAQSSYTPLTWARELLHRLGAPDTPANESALVGWEAAEGGNWRNTDRFNPLNTTQYEPGAVSTNAPGVKAYTSWEQGFQATIDTLTNGLYAPIIAALDTGTDARAVTDAVNSSPWGTHGAAPASTSGGYATLNSSGPTGSSGGSSPTGSSGKTGSGDPCNPPGGWSTLNPGAWAGYAICKIEEDAKPALFTVAAILAGTTLVVLGLWRSVSKTETYKTAKQTATTAAMGAEVA